MDENSRDNLWKVLKVIIFLFCSIVFILPYLVQIATYFHEKAHQEVLDKYELENYYNFDPIMTIPNFWNFNREELGATGFNPSEYQTLDKYQRIDFHVAGIISDLRLILLMGVYLCITNLYLFYKLKIQSFKNTGYVLAINWIIFIWLLFLILVTIANVSAPTGDVNLLVRLLKTC